MKTQLQIFDRVSSACVLTVILSAFLISCSATAMTSRQAADIAKAAATNAVLQAALTNAPAPAVTNAPPPVFTNAVESAPVQAPSEFVFRTIAAGTFIRPAIAIGPDGRLYVAAEGPGMASVHSYVTDAKGRWTGKQVVTASRQTALRTYCVNVLPGIISFRYGNKEDGEFRGPGTYDGIEKFHNFSEGAARLAMSKSGPILMSKEGEWKNLATGQRGKYNAGKTGEKFAFDIRGDTWATCHNGYSAQASAVSINGQLQTWADYATYGNWYGNDLCYPDVLIAPDGSVWCASVYNDRLVVQQFVKGKPRWPVNALRDLGPATLQIRCPPRLVATQKAVEVVFVKAGSIYRINVERGPPVEICRGTFPDVVSAGKTIHMTYIDGAKLLYRSIGEP